MNIGIYGDSFAEFDKIAKHLHWSTIVVEKLNAKVENFGYPATSLYYSYKKFLENYTKHDLIIVAVTNPDRYIKMVDWCDTPDRNNSYINSYEHVIRYKNTILNDHDQRMLTHLEGWYIMSDSDYNSRMNELMMKHMESLHKNIIFYPCFVDSFLPERYSENNFPKFYDFFSLVKQQIKLINYRGKIDLHTKENTHIMAGHLFPEMNEYVAETIVSKITTGDWKFLNLDNVKLKHPITYYYNIE